MMIMEEKSERHNYGKPQWSQVHFRSLVPLVRVLEFGAGKYEKNNWKKGLDPTEILESLSRHLFSLMDGETHDKESGLHHIGHIMANAMFYVYHTNVKKDIVEDNAVTESNESRKDKPSKKTNFLGSK